MYGSKKQSFYGKWLVGVPVIIIDIIIIVITLIIQLKIISVKDIL